MIKNPVFLTHFRLRWRSTFWPITVFGGLIAGLFLVSIINDSINLNHLSLELGLKQFKMIFMAQSVLCCLFAAISIFGSITKDQISGMLEHTRLTPLAPYKILLGYVFGPTQAVSFIFLSFAVTGLSAHFVYQIPFHIWLASQLFVLLSVFVFAMLAFFLAWVRGQEGMNNFALILSTLVLVVYGSYNPGSSIYSYFSPGFPLEYLLNSSSLQEASKEVLVPQWFGMSLNPIWAYISFSFLFIAISWLYNCQVFRVAKNFWQSELILLSLFSLFGLLQLGLALKSSDANSFSAELNLWIVSALFLILVFANRKISVPAFGQYKGPAHFVFSRSALSPLLMFALVGGLFFGLTVFQNPDLNVQEKSQKFALFFGNFVFVVLAVGLWMDIARQIFKKRKTAISLVVIFLALAFPQLILSTILEEKYMALLASPFTWSLGYGQDTYLLCWTVHFFLFTGVVMAWMLLVLKPSLNQFRQVEQTP